MTAPAGPGRIGRPLLAALTAALFYGSWAAVANVGHGVGPALRAGGVQAAMSFGAALSLVTLLEALFRRASTPARGFWISAVGTSILAVAILVTVHALVGTPRVLLTIAPSAVIGTIFYFGYARMLLAGARRDVCAPSRRLPGLPPVLPDFMG